MRIMNTKTYLAFVVPSVLAFALSGVYTIVDGFFIGQRLGDIGLAAITMGYPVAALVSAVGTGIGLSGGIRYTILSAQGAEDKRRACFSGTVVLMLLVSAILTLLLAGFTDPILRLLGARGEMLTLSVNYARAIAVGTVFQLLSTGFVPFIRNMGGASFAMAAMIAGFLTNIVLDYLFVWVWDLGVVGGAAATVLGQAVTMAAAIGFFIAKKCRLRLPALRELVQLWGTVLKVALSPFGLTFSPTLTMLFMNRFLLLYGSDREVAVYGCIGYVIAVIYLLLQGVGDGSQPLLSESYGRNDPKGMRHVLRLAYATAGVITVLCMIAVFLTRRQVGVLFGMSADANEGVIHYLPYFLAPLLFLAFVRITTSYFYATEKTSLSYVLVYSEPGWTLILLIVLPLALKLTGVWLAIPLAQVITFFTALAAKIYTDKKPLA